MELRNITWHFVSFFKIFERPYKTWVLYPASSLFLPFLPDSQEKGKGWTVSVSLTCQA